MKKLFGRDIKKAKPPVVGMSDAEKTTIVAFTKGDASKRDESIAIHRRHISTIGVRGDAYQRFMAETDHPAPDLGLRAAYRGDLLALVGA